MDICTEVIGDQDAHILRGEIVELSIPIEENQADSAVAQNRELHGFLHQAILPLSERDLDAQSATRCRAVGYLSASIVPDGLDVDLSAPH